MRQADAVDLKPRLKLAMSQKSGRQKSAIGQNIDLS